MGNTFRIDPYPPFEQQTGQYLQIQADRKKPIQQQQKTLQNKQ